MNIADLFATLRIAPDDRSFSAADSLISGVKTALVGLAAVAGAHVLASFVEDTVALGSHINDLAQSTGVTTNTLQELGYAATLNSSDMDGMAAGLGKLQIAIGKATQGSEEQIKSFQQLGVKFTDAHGKARPVGDVFNDISINQAKMKDQSAKLTAGMGVMGKGFKSLVPTMNDVAQKGMGNLITEAHELGAVMDGDAISALDEFGDTQDKVKAGLIGLRNQAVIALLPTLQDLADKFLVWVKANREMIAQKLHTALNILVTALRGVAIAANIMLKVFEFVERNWVAVKVGVVSLVGALLIFKAASIAAAIESGVAWAAANLPLILLAALLAALILIVDDVITAFQGGDSVLQKFFQERFGVDLVDAITRIGGATRAAFTAVIDWASAKIDWLIKKGEQLSKFVFELVHGDSQFQLDEANAGSQLGATRVRTARAMLGANPTKDNIDTYAKLFNLSSDERDAITTRVATPGANVPAQQTQNVTITAPLSITLPPGNVEDQLLKVVAEHWNEQIRNATANLKNGGTQ